ncbi:hypothetical protein [Actinomadura madurae]|uniref:hypothetical protein n=1 Tax=Actinomadura madurae TaxID=1993 RepID=UPI0020D1FE25|nr:hypothetical protein [Actinomadura madurae]MCP9964512.1 hypothetical protein [Actinomadura madurae]MCP9976994.1 hypothetical protein [Actinomadura madurae]MCQ0011505.1 hypothetical protein [Actinomadura madurae]
MGARRAVRVLEAPARRHRRHRLDARHLRADRPARQRQPRGTRRARPRPARRRRPRRGPLDYDGLAAWLRAHPYEGIVWHAPDGRMAKLKRRDFRRPASADGQAGSRPEPPACWAAWPIPRPGC